jgi:hypothetical protein
VNPELTWSWDFLGQSITRNPLTFTQASLNQFNNDYIKAKNLKSTSLTQLTTSIKHALVKVKWSDNPVVSQQTPLRKINAIHPYAPKIRHYMFIIAELCLNYEELKVWSGSQSERYMFDHTFMELVTKELWLDAASKRVCISWLEASNVFLPKKR